MSFFEAVSSCFSKYATFSGRASRSEYWWFMLFWILATTVINLLAGSFLGAEVGSVIGLLVVLGLFIPTVAVSARRLHDMNHSGWWQLLALTGIGGLVLVIWYMFRGTPGTNRFGDPVVELEDQPA